MLGKYYQRIMVTAFPGLKSLALEPNYEAFQLSLQSWENLILVTHSENTQEPGLPVNGCWFLCLLGGGWQLGMDVCSVAELGAAPKTTPGAMAHIALRRHESGLFLSQASS